MNPKDHRIMHQTVPLIDPFDDGLFRNVKETKQHITKSRWLLVRIFPNKILKTCVSLMTHDIQHIQQQF